MAVNIFLIEHARTDIVILFRQLHQAAKRKIGEGKGIGEKGGYNGETSTTTIINIVM